MAEQQQQQPPNLAPVEASKAKCDALLFKSTWDSLCEGMDMVFKRQHMHPKYYMNLYQTVYKFCTSQDATASVTNPMVPISNQHLIGQELYEALQEYVGEHADAFTAQAMELCGESLLDFFTREWDNFRFSARVLDGIFGYLNRHWIRREQDEGKEDVFGVYSTSLQVFKVKTFDVLETKLRRALFEEILKERKGDTITSRHISQTLQCLIEIGLDKVDVSNRKTPLEKPLHIYKDSFETPYLEETRLFYTNEVRELLQCAEPDCKGYMKRVWQRIQQEEHRVSTVLHSSTLQEIRDVCNATMITEQLQFMQSHFAPLLVEKADDDLGRMYNLCSRVPTGLDALRKALNVYVTKEGHGALEQNAKEAFQDPKVYVHTILGVHERYQGLVERAFSREPGFLKALDSAAIVYMNVNAVTKKAPASMQSFKSAELVARFCDGIMKKSSKMPDEMEMDVIQKKIITIFKYIEDKDVFMKFYTKAFCKRLINDLSASDEAETSFISKLTECCGYEYTSRLAKMVQDCQVSKDLTSSFKEKGGCAEAKKLEFAVKVLSTGAWPSFQQMPLNLPQILTATMEGLRAFYDIKYTGRRLLWAMSQSRGEVTCSAFKGKKYVFGTTTAQMCTLLLFNESTSYTAEALMNGTGMTAKNAATVIGSLVKHQVLSSDAELSAENEIPMTAKVSLNSAYTNKKVRVDLSKMTVAVQQARDSEQVKKTVEEDRKNVMAACIVRIMKARKTLSHQHLILEVINQLSPRFPPKVEMIKRSIGFLIEKEYMKRNDESRDMYDYIS